MMQTGSSGPVVVGVDGSEQALFAVRLATREAARHGVALKIVHAFIWPLMRVPTGPSEAGPPEGGLRNEAERFLKQAADEAANTDAAVPVSTELLVGSATGILLHEARHASLVVIGERGTGGFTGLLVGSTAVQVTAHTDTPVLVARGQEHPGGPVLLGVDGSPESERAVELAFAQASARGADLLAVHAWRGPASTGPGDMMPLVYDVSEVEEEESRVLAEALAGHIEKYPEVVVHQQIAKGRPAKALLRLSDQAQLLVVGGRGRGGFAGLLLGSVSHKLLHHADCPVLIVHRADREEA